MPRYSVIIPFLNAQAHLPRVLSGLSQLGQDWEVLVVDDGSDECPAAQVESLLPEARFLQSSRNPGAAGARNHGASEARGDFLVFLDSDVMVAPETLNRMVQTLEERPGLTGLFGCYSRHAPPEHSSLSRFRNLLHRYVHRQCAGLVESFWTGLGAIRRDHFLASGGFDEGLSGGASIEDVEFGARLSERGHKLLLDPQFEGVHLKSWDLWNLIRTDLLQRAAPWTQLLFQGRIGWSTLNGSWRFRLGPLLLLTTALMAFIDPPLAGWTGLAYLLWILPQGLWLAYEGGGRVALIAFPALVLHHACCCLGAGLGCLRMLASRRPEKQPIVITLADGVKSERRAAV